MGNAYDESWPTRGMHTSRGERTHGSTADTSNAKLEAACTRTMPWGAMERGAVGVGVSIVCIRSAFGNDQSAHSENHESHGSRIRECISTRTQPQRTRKCANRMGRTHGYAYCHARPHPQRARRDRIRICI